MRLIGTDRPSDSRIDSRRSRRPARSLSPAGLLLCGLYLAGCQLTTEANYASPPYSEQQRSLLEVVPYGTARNKAVQALRRAGVVGTFGVSESVYYCDAWDRDDGLRWRLDVALFFDQSGRLYKVGPAQANTGLATQASDGSHPGVSRPQTGRAHTTQVGSPSAEFASGLEWSPGNDEPHAERAPAGRSGRRTPFADPDGLR